MKTCGRAIPEDAKSETHCRVPGFVERMMDFEAKTRMAPEEAINHGLVSHTGLLRIMGCRPHWVTRRADDGQMAEVGAGMRSAMRDDGAGLLRYLPQEVQVLMLASGEIGCWTAATARQIRVGAGDSLVCGRPAEDMIRKCRCSATSPIPPGKSQFPRSQDSHKLFKLRGRIFGLVDFGKNRARGWAARRERDERGAGPFVGTRKNSKRGRGLILYRIFWRESFRHRLDIQLVRSHLSPPTTRMYQSRFCAFLWEMGAEMTRRSSRVKIGANHKSFRDPQGFELSRFEKTVGLESFLE